MEAHAAVVRNEILTVFVMVCSFKEDTICNVPQLPVLQLPICKEDEHQNKEECPHS